MKITRSRILKLGLILFVIAVCFPIFYFVLFLQFIRVPTGAMANTIIPGDQLVVKKRAFGEINRGDVIIFSYPKDTSVSYIFRVIGLPREAIEVRGKMIYINGEELHEQRVIVKADNQSYVDVLSEISTEGSGPYRVFYSSREEGIDVPQDVEESAFGIGEPFKIPNNEYFVMGDNRDNSYDSRFWGTVPRALVHGKATMIYWSAGRDKEGKENIRWNRVFQKIRNTNVGFQP